jgi:hypothetical protein
MSVCPHQQLLPIGNAGAHVADVDVIEGLGVRPDVFDIVDLELQVRGNPGGLDGGEVVGDDGCGGKFVGEFHGPDSGAGSDVEDALDGSRDGSAVEFAAEDEPPDVMN